MKKEEKIVLISKNSDLSYEELEKMPLSSINSLYETHVLQKNGLEGKNYL